MFHISFTKNTFNVKYINKNYILNRYNKHSEFYMSKKYNYIDKLKC